MKELIKALLVRRSARTVKAASSIAARSSEMLPWQGEATPKRRPTA